MRKKPSELDFDEYFQFCKALSIFCRGFTPFVAPFGLFILQLCK